MNNCKNLGGHIWQGRRGIVDGVICLGGATEILGGGICPGLNPVIYAFVGH